MKFLDLLKTNKNESIHQGYFLQSRTKARGSTEIRDLVNSCYKLYRLGIRKKLYFLGAIEKLKSFCSLGSTSTSLKLKRIDGTIPQEVESAVQFDPTRGNLLIQESRRIDCLQNFLNFDVYSGAWSILSRWCEFSGLFR